MTDTEILDEVLEMIKINVIVDWIGNDPPEEFQEIANFIRDKRVKEEDK